MKLSAGNSDAPAVLAERGEVDLLDDLLVHVVGHLNLGHLRLSNLNSGSSNGGGVGVSSIGSIGVGTISITAEEGVSGVSEGNSGGGGLGFGLSLISLTPLSGLTLGKTGNGESKDVLASGLLDSVGQSLNGDLNLLGHQLGHLGGVSVGEGRGQGIGIPSIQILALSGRNNSKHQLKI